MSAESSCRDKLDVSRTDSYPHLCSSLHVSSHSGSLSVAGAWLRSSVAGVVPRAWCAGAAEVVRSCFAASCFARARACTEGVTGACKGDTTRRVRFQCPRGRGVSKEGVSSPSDDKTPFPDRIRACARTAGLVRGPVVGSKPGRRSSARGKNKAVTPSVHLGVQEYLSVTPGPGEVLRQQLGWKKVLGTANSGIWVLQGEPRGYELPSSLDHLGVVWMEKRTRSTAWVTPTHACLCPYQYGRGAAVGPQSRSSIWDGVMGLWGRVAPLLTPWCSLREIPSGVNLNRYAGRNSCIPWHSDDEPLFGDQGDPKVIVSMSLGSSVHFRVRSRGSRNVLSPIRLNHGDLLVMDGLVQSEYEHSTSSMLHGPRANLTYRWITQHTSTCNALRARVCCALPSCAQGLPGLGSRLKRGAFLMPHLVWVFPLADGRCVPHTGVRLDCPLGVALPTSLPCLSTGCSYSGATCSSTRAGALDWGKTVENAVAA